ncbi:MAG TPA: serine hydrolase domain-containing protein [Acidimicrobiia bacterium]|nr:serine hydrolase domain-containing protein [Acidimicrobiia bacterium]
MSNAFSKTGLDRMHDVMRGYVERGNAAGLVTLVQRDGETHVDAIGAQALAGPPMTRDTIFRISSMSKPVTAVAVLILLEECVLRLDDSVDEFLPELANPRVIADYFGPLENTVPADRPITVRDLLTFRAGHGLTFAMPGESPLFDATQAIMPMGPPQPQQFVAPDEWMRALATLPLVHQPGEQWLYNTGSDILSVLVARAAGQPFDAFLRERIFEPLGMPDTGFVVPADKRDRFATSYTTNPETGALEVFDEPDGQWATAPAFASGAGGLVSTIDDFARFGTMLLNGGELDGTRVVSRPSVELMTTDHLTPANKAVATLADGAWDDHGYGFGVSVATVRTQLQSIGSYGWDGGLGTSWYNDPRERLQTILLTQAAWKSPDPPEVSRDFWTCAYAALAD